MLVEVCVDSVASAINAETGGAHRLELCQSLIDGGITPSKGMISLVVKRTTIPVFVLIRPRGGDFLYSEDEILIMELDIVTAKECGAAGVVIGALNADGSIDKQTTKRLINCARPLKVTFHRAIDVCSDPLKALKDLHELGIDRILTSGCCNKAEEGVETIKKLIDEAGKLSPEIKILVGSGVREENAKRIAAATNTSEIHAGSLTKFIHSKMTFRPSKVVFMGGEKQNTVESEYLRKVIDENRVKSILGEFDTNKKARHDE